MCIRRSIRLTGVSGEFTVSGFSRANKISCNDHRRETQVAVIPPDQRSEGQPDQQINVNNVEKHSRIHAVHTPVMRFHLLGIAHHRGTNFYNLAVFK